MQPWFALLAFVLAQVAPQAGPITLGQFLDRYGRVERMPAEAARQDPEVRALMGELGRAVAAWKASVEADTRAGRAPRACPRGKVTFNTREIVPILRTLPAAMRDRPFRQAMTSYLDSRFPCPAVAPAQPNIPSATRISRNSTRIQLMKKVSTQARMKAENQLVS
jgi:hypothetical protein